MKQDILDHLRGNKPYAGSTLAQFLRDKKGGKTQQEVKDALQSLLDEESITSGQLSPVQLFDEQQLNGPMSAFQGNFGVDVKITWKGERRWEEVRSFTQQSNVNDSLIATNTSIRKLNRFQRCMAYVTAGVAIVSLLAISVPIFLSKPTIEIKDIQTLKSQLDSSKAMLDDINRAKVAVEASLLAIRDSIRLERLQAKRKPKTDVTASKVH
jgi:hypothetical protein